MDLLSLFIFGVVNLVMVVSYLRQKGQYCQFPFWAGIISLGFFFTQAVGGLAHVRQFPAGAYSAGMLSATLCMLALWIGFELAIQRSSNRTSWLSPAFNVERLYYAGVFFAITGIFFQWKLWSLPEELLNMSQWSGATVKYNFFASLFQFGLITMWILYLDQRKLLNTRILVFLIPCLLLLADAAILRGRRAGMMNMCAYIVVGSWLVRRIAMPRWMLVLALVGGLIWVNSVSVYRSIMLDEDRTFSERLSIASQADYLSASKEAMEKSNIEFVNYINFRYICAKHALHDYGAWHWNNLVFNYVPAQLFGAQFKRSICFKEEINAKITHLARSELNHVASTGSTVTGFMDAYRSFGWLGFMKFGLIGWLMGILYRRAMQGFFLGQLLYVYFLSDAMHAITHSTGQLLFSSWVYFFALAFPVFYWAIDRCATHRQFEEYVDVQR